MSARIHTIEDNFQYRVHHLLKKMVSLHKDIEPKDKESILIPFEEWIESKEGRSIFAEYVLNDIEDYCGLEEAIENEY